jgi:hypothetical protein
MQPENVKPESLRDGVRRDNSLSKLVIGLTLALIPQSEIRNPKS